MIFQGRLKRPFFYPTFWRILRLNKRNRLTTAIEVIKVDNYINDKLIEATFLFCRKRISDSEAAKDLAQDILCEGIKTLRSGKEPVSFYSYYWRMARNKYVDYIRYKREPALPLETAGGVVSENPHPSDKLVQREEIARLNLSLSRLSDIHREIIIRFYLKQQPVSKIARELNVPVGTVKGRLFDARKKLKERFDTMTNTGKSAYAPYTLNWFWGYNCGKATEIFNSKIAQQVMVLCGQNGKSLNELADEMGVAPVYLEQVIDEMVTEKLLFQPVKNKYLSCCCVFPQNEYIKASAAEYIANIENNIPEKVCKAVYGVKDEIMSLDFYGKDLGFDYLCWEFLIRAANFVGYIAMNYYSSKLEDKYPDETDRKFRMTVQYLNPEEEADYSCYPDGKWKGMNWSNLHQNFKTASHGTVEYVNDFDQEPFPHKFNGELLNGVRDYWINGNNISLLLDLAKDPEKPLNKYEEEIAADFVKNGILAKTDKGLKVMMPIFPTEVSHKIDEIIQKAVEPIAKETVELIAGKVEKLLLPYVRKDLMSNFIHWDMRMFFQPINVVMYYGMYESDHLSKHEDFEHSAAGLWLMTE